MIFVIGARGLVGSAIARYLESKGLEYRKIQKENSSKFIGKSCDILIYANGNAFKYKAKEDPWFDFEASVASLAGYVNNINFKKFVHISTVDVYDNTFSTSDTMESATINTFKLSTYGYHKYLAENYVQHFCDDYLIFRLPGLVGKGLTKNPAYDFIHSHKSVMISGSSRLNFIHTDFVADSIFRIIEMDIKNEIFNLAAYNSIEINDMAEITGLGSNFSAEAELYVQNYDINIEKISRYIKLESSEEAIKKYFRELSLSN